MTDQRPSFLTIQSLRGLAALMVVLFHLRIVEAKYGGGEVLLPSSIRFADGGVDLFFVISGFVMATVASGRFGSTNNALRFLARRAWRVIPPYWFYTTIVVALMLLAPGLANGSYKEQSILASYLLWPHHQLPILTVGWTLVHEMYFYVVMAAAIALLHERQLPAFLMAWAAIVLGAQPLLQGGVHPVPALVFNPMTLEFIMGAWLGLVWTRLPKAAAIGCLVLGAIAFAAGLIALDRLGIPSQQPMLRTVLFGTSSALIVAGAASLEAHGHLTPPRWIVQIGDSSYSLYLSHVFVISAAGRAWQMTSWNAAGWQHLLFLLATVAACVAVGLVSWRLLERPLLTLGNGWTSRQSTAAAPAG